MSCPTSLTIALNGTRSSRTPMKKITNKATRMNLILAHPAISIQIREEIKNPIKIAMPPIDGVTFLWIFLRPGISSKFFFKEYLMMTGTIRKAMTNDVIVAASSMAMIQGLKGENKERNGIDGIF